MRANAETAPHASAEASCITNLRVVVSTSAICSRIPAGGFRQAAENDRFAPANPSFGGLAASAPESYAALNRAWRRVAPKSEASAFKKLVFIRVHSWLVEAE